MNPGEPRHIDTASGALEGEAARMRVDRAGWSGPARLPAPRVPLTRAEEEAPTYYGLPVVKAPPWLGYVPAYFYAGGVAGAAATLGGALQVLGGRDQRRLVMRCRWVALAGVSSGALFLVLDLGLPWAWYRMLRVFRPTSALNMGAWIIGAGLLSSGASVAARGRLAPLGEAAGIVAGLNGPLLATYTATVLTTTAIPAWAGAARSMPLLFGASSVSSAMGLLALLGDDAVVHRLLGPSTAIEIAASGLVRAELGGGAVGEPLRRGRSGRLWRAAQLLGAGALAASLVDTPRARRVAGGLATAAGLVLRFAVLRIGEASARDPQATLGRRPG